MNEEVGQQKYRTVVRGSCVSYLMPWEDILRQLMAHGKDKAAYSLPRPREALKYLHYSKPIFLNLPFFSSNYSHMESAFERPEISYLSVRPVFVCATKVNVGQDQKKEQAAFHPTRLFRESRNLFLIAGLCAPVDKVYAAIAYSS